MDIAAPVMGLKQHFGLFKKHKNLPDHKL